jgi:Tfp pilus assembly protein PilW
MRLRLPRTEAGFTVAELLVACAMVGVVMAGLFSILTTGQRTYANGTNQVEAQQAVRLALLRMTNEIREAGFCPRCGTSLLWSQTFPAIVAAPGQTAPNASGFTIQNDWNGTWDGSTGIATSGTVTQVVMAADGTTSNVTRGEQIIYRVTSNNLTRQEIGIDGSAVTVVSNLSSLTFSYLDATGAVFTPTATTMPNIRAIVVRVSGQPPVQAQTFAAGKVLVTMTDSVRLRNRAQ